MKNTRRPFCFLMLVCCLLYTGRMFAQQLMLDPYLPAVDSMFTNYASSNHFPGTAFGLIANGKLVYTGSAGLINIDKKIPSSPTAAFRIASMSKSFTAMGIMKLRDQGKLRLDDPVYLYIPEMKDQRYPTKDASAVTIRQLLNHEAGFPEDNPWGDRQLAVPDATLEKLIKEGISYSNDPGIGYEYSNLGFAMLGLIIKKVSGMPYQIFIRENIWKPLGMNNTYWEYANVPEEKLAHGYRYVQGNWVEQPMLHDGSYGAMGGMITTIEDFSKYIIFHLSAWPPSDAAETGPVKRSSVREMHHPGSVPSLNAAYKYPSGRPCAMTSAYAFGLRWAKDCEGRVIIGHAGGLPGFGSQWTILPDYGIGIVSFSNLTYASAGYINGRVLDSLIHLAKLQPRPIPVSEILKTRQQQLLTVLPSWRNAQKAGIFAENFFLDYFTDQLKQEAEAIYQQIGTVVKVHEMVPENNLRGSFIIEGAKASCIVHFTLTPEKNPLIQEYNIELLH